MSLPQSPVWASIRRDSKQHDGLAYADVHDEMLAEQGASWMVFDGTIYNQAELSKHAQGMPGSPRAADLILSLMLSGGIDALHSVNGIFAFVMWDNNKKRLLAARDRFGLRTMYWHKGEEIFALGPRIFPLVDALGIKRSLNYESAVEFLVNGFTDQGEKTLVKSVFQVPAGAMLEFNPSTDSVTISNWYVVPKRESKPIVEEEAVEGFRELLSDAVRLRAQSSDSGALMLSGGIDSSAIACLLAQQGLWRPLRSYKTYLSSELHDVREHVVAIEEYTNAKHRSTSIAADDLFGYRPAILRALELPYERSIISAHWALCEMMANDGVQLTLDGVGADEQLGGYRVFQSACAAFSRGETLPGLAYVGASRPHDSFDKSADLENLYAWLAPDARGIAATQIRAESDDAIESFVQMCHYHMHRGMLPILLRFNRELGRAFGQDSASPFLDHRLVEYAINLSDGLKIKNGRSKYVLRQAVTGIVPQKIVQYDNKTSYLDIEAAWLRGPGLEKLRTGVQQAQAELPLLFSSVSNTNDVDKLNLLRMWRVDCFGAWARLNEMSM